jgi:site-specific DNA-methyltransferase (adenine-specific)/modification methylase
MNIEEVKNKIICGDCIEVMKEIPDNSIDLVIIDPPYNISQDKKQINRYSLDYKGFKRDSSIKLDFGEWDKKTDEDFEKFTEDYFKELVRVMKNKSWGYICFSKERVGILERLIKKYNCKFRTIFVWAKTNPVPSFRKVNYNSACEFIVVFSKGDGKIKNFLNQKEMSNYMLTPNKSSYGETTHPTEKPIILFEKFVKTSSNEGDIVLDCFMGSGTTAVACLKNNRNFIGIELNPEYVKIAEARIKPYLVPIK